jgi:hypothetical protein
MVAVYRFELWNSTSLSYVRQSQYVTEAAIERLAGVPLYSTRKLVPANEVNWIGVWETLPEPISGDGALWA